MIFHDIGDVENIIFNSLSFLEIKLKKKNNIFLKNSPLVLVLFFCFFFLYKKLNLGREIALNGQSISNPNTNNAPNLSKLDDIICFIKKI